MKKNLYFPKIVLEKHNFVIFQMEQYFSLTMVVHLAKYFPQELMVHPVFGIDDKLNSFAKRLLTQIWSNSKLPRIRGLTIDEISLLDENPFSSKEKKTSWVVQTPKNWRADLGCQ